MIDANALIFGLIPNRTLEKTFIGSVVDPGPETKLAMTMSSRERVKARSHAASKAGVMIGMVITKKTFSARKVMIPFFGLKESLLLMSFKKLDSSYNPPNGWKINLPSDLQPTEIPFD